MGDVVARGNRRHKRLRSIAARHPDDLRTARDSALGELEQVVAGLEHDRLDASPPSLPARSKRSAFPPPDFRLMISAAESAAPTDTTAAAAVKTATSPARPSA